MFADSWSKTVLEDIINNVALDVATSYNNNQAKNGKDVAVQVGGIVGAVEINSEGVNNVIDDCHNSGYITHCIRICGRFGMYPESQKDPFKVEKILTELIAPGEGSDFCHRIVWFGREVCTARSPKCENCPLSDLCQHNLKKNNKA